MSKDSSFDAVSEFDLQELVNAIDQTKGEINVRFDLKNSKSKLELEGNKSLIITTTDEMKLKNILDILYSKMIKRELSMKILDPQKIESALGGSVKQVFLLKNGLNIDLSRKIVADIKAMKTKVQIMIQGNQVRVTGKNKDDLQEVIQMLREKQEEYNVALQFTNYR